MLQVGGALLCLAKVHSNHLIAVINTSTKLEQIPFVCSGSIVRMIFWRHGHMDGPPEHNALKLKEQSITNQQDVK